MWDLCVALWWESMLFLTLSISLTIKRQQIKVLSSKKEENDKIIQTMSLTETVTQPIKRPYRLPMPHPWSEKTLPQWAVINAQPLVDKIDQMLLQNDMLKGNSFGLSGCCLIADRKSVEFPFQHTRYRRENFKDSNTQVKYYYFSRTTPCDCKYNFPTCDLIKLTSH